jgi:hypothetical protein
LPSSVANHESCAFASVNADVCWLQIGGRVVDNLNDATAKDSNTRATSGGKRESGEMPVVPTRVVGGDASKPDYTGVV